MMNRKTWGGKRGASLQQVIFCKFERIVMIRVCYRNSSRVNDNKVFCTLSYKIAISSLFLNDSIFEKLASS
jgi:hypothetical protein